MAFCVPEGLFESSASSYNICFQARTRFTPIDFVFLHSLTGNMSSQALSLICAAHKVCPGTRLGNFISGIPIIFQHKSKYWCGPGSVIGIATAYGLDGTGIESRWGEIFRTSPDQPWGPPSLLYNAYRVFPGGKVLPGRDADPSPPSSAEV